MPARARRPFVSVVIPCRNEEHAIEACLESVLRQSYPSRRMEVLVADGRSSDGTLAVVRRFAGRHPDLAVRIVPNPDVLQAAGCNRAIRASRGEIIVRLDAHAHYDAHYIERAVAVLGATGAANVGGAARPVARNSFQRAVASALRSRLSMGGAAYWNAEREGWVDTVWNGVFPRSTFEEVGLFDPRARTNEDAELNLRIAKAGKRIFLSRALVAHYYPRSTLGALIRQYFFYGHGRARTVLKHRRLQSPRPLAPASLLLALVALGLLSTRFGWAAAAAAAIGTIYAAAIAFEAARIGSRDGALAGWTALLILPSMHLAHGAGFLTGLARYAVRPDWSAAPPALAPRAASPSLSELLRTRRTTPTPRRALARTTDHASPPTR